MNSKKFLALLLSAVLCFSLSVTAFASDSKGSNESAVETTSNNSGISPYGMNYGSSTGIQGVFNVNLTSGGNSGSAVFRIYTSDQSACVYFKITDPNGKVVINRSTPGVSTPLYPKNGAEQTIYFNSGCSAPAGRYTISYTVVSGVKATINTWICSW